MNRYCVFASVLLLVPSAAAADEGPAVVGEATYGELIEQVRPSVATIKVSGRDGNQIAMGTGFAIDSNGLIVTNFHVIGEGRPFTVQLSSGRDLPVIAIEASDRNSDLAIIRVGVGDEPLEPLALDDTKPPKQGTKVLAFGNPLGLENSVVAGIVSAVREVEGTKMIQLAMPIEPGNSGGPVVDLRGRVCGIINMKSAINDNLGFAIPMDRLVSLRDKPNPVSIQRWVRLGRIDERKWKPLFGATWQQRGGLVTARGLGNGFGGRSLCLTREAPLDEPMEIAVEVRLDDESGAAGLAFYSDGQHRHYGFYPSNGRLRLTCFKGPSVYSWQVLQEVESKHYLPEEWNRLRVRIEPGKLKCFLNGELVIESSDAQLTSGDFGLVKFRATEADFKSFRFAKQLPPESLSEDANRLLSELMENDRSLSTVNADQIGVLAASPSAVSRQLAKHARELEQRAERMRQLASDVKLAPALDRLQQVMSSDSKATHRLLRGALLIARLDNPDIDVDSYVDQVDGMAKEIREGLNGDADAIARREAIHQYMFHEMGFHGGRAEYYHPANSHLNRVIDDREGLPITLSILYIELGRRLGLTMQGIGLPGHFVVNHVMDDANQLVDVFERGKLMTRAEAVEIVASFARRALRESDLRPQTDVEILSRVLSNLIGVAGRNQDLEGMHRYCEAIVAVDPESVDFRIMRSRVRAMTGRNLAALEDIDWLLENDPPGMNHAEVLDLRRAIVERQQNE